MIIRYLDPEGNPKALNPEKTLGKSLLPRSRDFPGARLAPPRDTQRAVNLNSRQGSMCPEGSIGI